MSTCSLIFYGNEFDRKFENYIKPKSIDRAIVIATSNVNKNFSNLVL